jgi:hypothetical protein
LPNKFVEQPLNEEVRSEIREFAIGGASRLHLATDDPEEVARAIMEYMEAVRPLAGDRLVDEALELGCLWAEQVLSVTAWEWAELRTDRGSPNYGIVSSDRALTVFPTNYLRELLADSDRDNTALLLFNMIRGGNVPAADPGDYEVFA